MNLSPLTVPYRIVQRGTSIIFAAAIGVFSGAPAAFGGIGFAVAVTLIGGFVVLLVTYEFAHYYRYEYELTADTLDIQSGVFFQRNREIPLRRIQNVDISRGLTQRALGIAAVDLETAGGSETEASIRFVTFEEAKRLQQDIRRRKRRLSETTDGAEEPETTAEEGTLLFELSDRELLLVALLSFDLRVPGVLLFLLSGAVPAFSVRLPASVAGRLTLVGIVATLFGVVVAIAAISWVMSGVTAVTNYYGFSVTRVGDELQYERGLFRRYDGSIPLDKVQTLTVTDDPLKRHFGYATLTIETAGYAPGHGTARQAEAIVPLATRARVFELANDVESIGTPTFERPPRRVRRRYAVRYGLALAALTGALFGVNAVVTRAVPWYLPLLFVPVALLGAHYKWKHRGYWLGENHVATRNGVLRRRTKMVPYYRIQTVIDSRTVFQRRWRVATVVVDTAGSLSLASQDAAAVDVDEETAARLRATLLDRFDDALAAQSVTKRLDRGAPADGARERSNPP